MARLTNHASVLRALDLDRQNALNQAQFYLAYADMLENSSPAASAGDAWARVAHPAQKWLGKATIASACRAAAQYAALVDSSWAARLAVRTGRAYVAAGMPFGLFLLAGVLSDQILRDSNALRELVAPFATLDSSSAMADPVQQMYLLLAAASRPWLRTALAAPIDGLTERLSPHALHPFGPQGMPLGEFLDLATVMLNDDQTSSGATGTEIRSIARRLAVMQRAQAESLRAARRNRYLWTRAASPVNIVDLEHVAIYGLALRHRPWAAELRAALSAELEREDDALAELPAWATDSIDATLPRISRDLIAILRRPDRGPNLTQYWAEESQTADRTDLGHDAIWRPAANEPDLDLGTDQEPPDDDDPDLTL